MGNAGKSGFRPKGRVASPAARAEIAALLAADPGGRDRLIEWLHGLQDRHGALFADHLAALAEALTLPLAEILEVASFYHHFDLCDETTAPPPPLTVRVCDSVACMMAGAEDLLAALGAQLDPAQVRVVRASCLGRCDAAPAVLVGRRSLGHADPAQIRATLTPPPPTPTPPPAPARGGYQVLEACLGGRHSARAVIETMSDAGLRGLGGAGFPAGRKWAAVHHQPGPRLMTINADEGEPGTFKDRFLLERAPHRVLEGALIAAWAVGAERIYLYLRDEYPDLHDRLTLVLADIRAAGLDRHAPIDLRRGAGAYICGEESAMLDSIEGKRGLPRQRPPFIAEAGLFGRPTLNHNVETLYWVTEILQRGPAWFAAQGVAGASGFRAYSVSGRVRDPGVKIAPAGTSARVLIDAHAGGMLPGHVFTAYLPGGASGGILPAHLADLPLDFGRLDEQGCFVGSGAVVVLSDHDDPWAVGRNLLRFFARESCGQCTPCRVGCEKLVELLAADKIDAALIGALDGVMRDASICGLGQAAPNPARSLLRFFARP